MKVTRDNLPALGILVAVLVWNACALRAELHSGGVDLNDNVSHYRLAADMAGVVDRGGNPLDFWSPEWSLGFPQMRVYQPLAHLLVVLTYFALGKSVALLTTFVWIRYLSLVLLPLSFFVMARCFELPPLTAAAAACLAPLISTPQLYGLEYGSYVWAGFGLFPQAVATHFLLLTFGFAFRALRRGGSATLAGVMLGLTFLSQFVYGYMGALSVCLLALTAGAGSPRVRRLRGILWIGSVALLLSAFQLVPLWLDRALINHTPQDQLWKVDSFGAPQVMEWLATGQLLDSGRLPILSLLALAGLILLCLRFFSPRGLDFAGRFVVAGAALWISLFFGRHFWGPALWLLAITPDLPLHRFLGGAQIFLVMLAAIGLAAVWSELSRRVHLVAAGAATLVIFYPMVRERGQYLEMNATRLERSVRAMQSDRASLDALLAAVKERGGRAFAGLATPNSWGPSFRIGAVPMYHVLAAAGIPTVGYLSHTMALTSDVMLSFDERSPAQYRLFDIRSFLVPAGTKYPVPAFLKPGPVFGRFQIFDTPASGYFDLEGGEIVNASQSGEVYGAEFDATHPAQALFKMTWHPNWKAYVDNHLSETVRLSPGFVGIPVPAGHHVLLVRYEPGTWKLWMALGGIPAVLLMAIAERRFYSAASTSL